MTDITDYLAQARAAEAQADRHEALARAASYALDLAHADAALALRIVACKLRHLAHQVAR
jgi:hypothetical protein